MCFGPLRIIIMIPKTCVWQYQVSESQTTNLALEVAPYIIDLHPLMGGDLLPTPTGRGVPKFSEADPWNIPAPAPLHHAR